MSKLTDRLKVALLGAIAISGIITASEVRRIARTEFEVTISVEQADSLVREAKRAQNSALRQMRDEYGRVLTDEQVLGEGE